MKYTNQNITELFDKLLLPLGIVRVLTDEDGKPVELVFEYCNDAIATMSGIPKEELMSKPYYELFPDGDRSWLGYYYKAAYEASTQLIERASIEINKYLRIELHPVGEPGYVLCAYRDMSEEMAKKELDQYTGFSANYSVIATVNITTKEMKVYRADGYANVIKEYLHGEAFHTAADFFAGQFIAVEDRSRFLQETDFDALVAKLRKTELVTIMARVKPEFHQDGRIGYSKFYFRIAKDDPNIILLGAENITDSVLREREYTESLKAALEKAEAESKTKSDFFFQMSHELHTPMNAILGFAELLRSRKQISEDPELLDYLEKIIQAGRELDEKLSGILLDTSHSEINIPELFYEAENQIEVDSSALVGKRILLVDDNAFNAQIAMLLLKENGIESECAENGLVCLSMISSHNAGFYDAVLMDINMPVLNGYEAARAIRALDNKEKAEIPIIALSANSLPEDQAKAYDAGMNGFIAKPVDIPKLRNTITKVLI